jgi:glutamate decarboxylase
MHEGVPYTVYDVSEAVRTRGWLIPAYRLPPNLEDVAVLRIVVRDDMSRDLAEDLVEDLRRIIKRLERQPEVMADSPRTGFHH